MPRNLIATALSALLMWGLVMSVWAGGVAEREPDGAWASSPGDVRP